MPILTIDDLHAGYGKGLVLTGVNMEINEGGITCLIGPNGAGKSTVFRCIYNLIRPTSGTIMFRDVDIVGKHQSELLDLGISYVLQRDAVFPDMTVRENLELGAFTAKKGYDIDTHLSEIHKMFPLLKARQKQKAGTLSGGERQMLEIARGLMLDPELLMLDEPTAGLAPSVIDTVFEKITEINERGVTIMLVEQNINTALEYSDHGYVLVNGKTVYDGEASTLLEQPEIRDAYLGKLA